MPKPRQASLLAHPSLRHLTRKEHGGTLGKGLRKRERPLDPKRPLHVVLRSSRARGDWSMLRARHEKRIRHLVHAIARRHDIRVFRFANSGNHLHLVIQAPKRACYQNYLRSLSGLIARAVTGARKGRAKGKFWDTLAYSRVVEWGRELRTVDFYLILNELEGLGVWSRRMARQTSARPAPSGASPPG